MEIHGKTALVTGANSGLGRAVATALARGGARVLMWVRDRGRGAAAQQAIKAASGNDQVELFVGDLASQGSIRETAEAVRAETDTLSILVNNAGTAFPRRGLTEEGIERTLAVNHLGPFLLTHCLLDRLRASAPARIVNVGTRINTTMDLTDLNWERRRYTLMRAYAQAKLGNLHFTRELAQRLAGSGVTVNCVFPGVFLSNLGGTDGAQNAALKLFARTLGWALPKPEQAAERVMYLITSEAVAEVSGAYFGNRKRIRAPAQVDDPAANRFLWDWSAKQVGLDAGLTDG